MHPCINSYVITSLVNTRDLMPNFWHYMLQERLWNYPQFSSENELKDLLFHSNWFETVSSEYSQRLYSIFYTEIPGGGYSDYVKVNDLPSETKLHWDRDLDYRPFISLNVNADSTETLPLIKENQLYMIVRHDGSFPIILKLQTGEPRRIWVYQTRQVSLLMQYPDILPMEAREVGFEWALVKH